MTRPILVYTNSSPVLYCMHTAYLPSMMTLRFFSMSGHSPRRRCDLDLLAGPAVALRMGETDKFSSLEHATGGNQRLVKDVKSFDSFFGANMGFNLKCRATERIGVFAMPMFYYFGSQDVFCQESLAFKKTVLFTFNVGVQLKL